VQSLQSSHQLIYKKRLRQIIIRPQIQSFQSLVQFTSSRSHDHRHIISLCPETFENTQPISPWKHDIQDDRIIALSRRQAVAIVPIICQIDRKALLLQTLYDKV
jgi:hypothetical protein